MHITYIKCLTTIPAQKQSKLDKLVGQPVLAPGVDPEQANKELPAEMEAESWTSDSFDLPIVSHAKANGYSPLVTQDEKIHRYYPKAVR